MPIELVAPMPAAAPASAAERAAVVFISQLLALLLITGVWVGVQCVYFGITPTEVQTAIAGP